ncbi:MAG TPA: hypothetical protein VI603_17525 [Saprospiraceae bacterium]|nr:hypothetical protein [Saprospiraceae bacterium]
MNLGISDAQKRRVKDTLLLVLVFIVGLIGSCYILHIALSQPSSSVGFHQDPSEEHAESSEVIYVTGQ